LGPESSGKLSLDLKGLFRAENEEMPSRKLLTWRRHQKRGAIMKPSTFKRIAATATRKYGSKAAGEKAAGAAYWASAKAKYRNRRKH
jgi:hypothetical protein